MIKIKKLYKSVMEEAFTLPAYKGRLSPKVLSKDYEGQLRAEIFLNLIDQEYIFPLRDGKNVIIQKDSKEINFIRSLVRTDPETQAKYFDRTQKIAIPAVEVTTDENGNLVKGQERMLRLSSFVKIEQLGGESAQSRKEQEYIMRGELEELINNALQQSSSDSITIEIVDNSNGNKIDKVYKVIGVDAQAMIGKKEPKADFVLVTEDKPYYISHKSERFGQWGGVSAFSNHADVERFLVGLTRSKYVYYAPDSGISPKTASQVERDKINIPKGVTIGGHITDSNLKKKAVFGNDFGGKSGSDNVDAVIQGRFTLTKNENKPDTFILTAPFIMTRKHFDGKFKDELEPIIAARHMKDRNDLQIKNTRVAIYPKAGRVVREYVDDMVSE